MSSPLAALPTWYRGLAARDQRILRIGAVAAALILLLWVVLPMQRNLAEAREHLRQQQQDLDWMRKIGPSLLAAGPAPVAVATQDSLFGLVESSARESGVGTALTSKPTGSGGMSVTLANVDFNLLLGWLDRLSKQHGVRIETANITANGGAGLVNATVQLRAGS
jgi:general secretion pathway protein M